MLKSHKSKVGVIYICNHESNVPPGYYHNSFVTTHVRKHMMYGDTLLVSMNQRVLNEPNKECNISAEVHELSQSHCGDNREGTLFS